MSDPDSTPAASSAMAGRVWLAAMGLALAAAGIVFTLLLWHGYERAMETRAWTETPCEILSSVVISDRPTPHSPVQYRASVRYRYEVAGKSFTGSRVRRVEGPSPHREKAESVVALHPPGARSVCYVNPASAGEAILEHASKAALYAIWFPLLFVLGGGMMAWRAVRKKDSRIPNSEFGNQDP